jgi:hypothetical protein
MRPKLLEATLNLTNENYREERGKIYAGVVVFVLLRLTLFTDLFNKS